MVNSGSLLSNPGNFVIGVKFTSENWKMPKIPTYLAENREMTWLPTRKIRSQEVVISVTPDNESEEGR